MVLILENVALRTNFTLHVRTYSELPYNISTMAGPVYSLYPETEKSFSCTANLFFEMI